MADFIFPTTAGSIISYSAWADNAKTERFQSVQTLVPGHRVGGDFVDLIWADAYVGLTDLNAVSTEDILAGDPVVLFEAPASVELPNVSPQGNYGEVVTFVEEDRIVTATYTPGFLDSETGRVGEAFWVSSYGESFSFAYIEESNPVVFVEGSKTID